MNDAAKTMVRNWAFDPVCTLCGRRGHYPADCPFKPSRPDAGILTKAENGKEIRYLEIRGKRS